MPYTTLIDVPALRDLIDMPSVAVPGVEARGVPAPRVALIDCRFDLANPPAGRAAYLAGHLPGASHADLERDLSAPVGPATGRHPLPDPQALAERLGAWGVDGTTQVIAYDGANGSFAARLWWLLRWLGFGRVAVLDGGLAAWVAAGGALQTGPLERPARRFAAQPDPAAWLDTAAVAAARHDAARLIIDARAPERYAGAVEPLDPVAGHVPGAVNHPFAMNLGADGRFLPPAELRRRWLERLGPTTPGGAIAMCGSGVTACHNLLALEIAGLPGARLYAGSWSEWIRDPARPVATGSEP
jgi:thiosulfate/3-mercaptopyruvate sulfurtransferase